MNQRDLARWKRIARGMCYQGNPKATQARKDRLWREVESFIDEVEAYNPKSWEDETYLCDWCSEFFIEYDYHWDREGNYKDYTDRQFHFFDMLESTCRASIDMLYGNYGGGVLGYTIGDVKRILGVKKLPVWFLRQGWEKDLNTLPEETGLWL